MATNIYLGYPPENIKQWIIENSGPASDPTPVTFTSEDNIPFEMAFGICGANCDIDEQSTMDPQVLEVDNGKQMLIQNIQLMKEKLGLDMINVKF